MRFTKRQQLAPFDFNEAGVFLGVWVMLPGLWAGMPMPLPDDIPTALRLRGDVETRLQVISLFLLGLIVATLVVQWLWNGLRRDFTRLPRLSYFRALMLTVAWGLLFCIVLVMISGARELMTPGAWEKEGATYRLRSESSSNVEDS